MALEDKKNKKDKRRWIRKLRNKYRLVILNDETYEERLTFRLSRLNVFIVFGITAIILVVITSFVIAFTPLREYIPGYTDLTLSRRVNLLLRKTDSLERATAQKNVYIQHIKSIIDGGEVFDDSLRETMETEPLEFGDISYTRSPEDSILREEYRSETAYDLYYSENADRPVIQSPRRNFNFFAPLNGIITSEYDLSLQHYGIDIVTKTNEAVKATLDGTVLFSDWTVETGHVIAIQHQGSFISVYKHNSVLLKKQGGFVKAGEPIAIVGESGELSSGAHLHFELWYNGTPVNPKEYIVF
jgi:murein DD-endopeptidase MepM/ murein hydrolase activator NlpD